MPDSLSAQFVDSAKKLPSAVRYNKISGSFKAYNLAGLNGIIVGEIKEPVFVPISTGKDVYYIPIEAPTNGTFETIVDSVQRGIYSVSTSGGDITHTKELADKLFTLKALEDMVKKNDDDGPESNWTYQRMGGFASWAEAKTAQNGVNSSSGAIQNWFKEYLHAIDLKRSSDVAGWVNSIKKLRIQYPLLWKRE